MISCGFNVIVFVVVSAFLVIDDGTKLYWHFGGDADMVDFGLLWVVAIAQNVI